MIQRVIAIWDDGAHESYVIRADTSMLVSIPVWAIKEMGHDISIGFAEKKPKKPYNLYGLQRDWLMIHIDEADKSH